MRYWGIALLGYSLAGALYVLMAPLMSAWNVLPDFVMVLLWWACLFRLPYEGSRERFRYACLRQGLCAGFVKDCLSASALGPQMLLMVLVAVLLPPLKRTSMKQHQAWTLLMLLGIGLLYELCNLILQMILYGVALSWGIFPRMFGRTLAELVVFQLCVHAGEEK